ncbi:MAG: HAD hydrolase-like protein [archaeon]
MQKPVRIGVDLDGTLADYQKVLVKFVNKKYQKDHKLSEIRRDDCYDILGKNFISRAIKLRGFYSASSSLRGIPPLEGASDVLKELKNRGYDINIVTSRFIGFSKNTRKWIEAYFGKKTFRRVIFSNILTSYSTKLKVRKYVRLGVEIVIEDSPHVARKCSKLGMRVFLIDHPWNRGVSMPGVTRVSGWNEVIKKI